MTDQIQNSILLKVFLAMAIAFSSFMATRYIMREDKIYNIGQKIDILEKKIETKEMKEKNEEEKKQEINEKKVEGEETELNAVVSMLNKYFSEHGIEEALLNIVLKLDENKCDQCTQQDKETILQIKMMNSLRQRDIKSATFYLNKIGKNQKEKEKEKEKEQK